VFAVPDTSESVAVHVADAAPVIEISARAETDIVAATAAIINCFFILVSLIIIKRWDTSYLDIYNNLGD
jgi:hypothetical protein